MLIHPISYYAVPGYPTKNDVDSHPEIMRLLPKRWKNIIVMTAFSTACLAMTRCIGKARGHFAQYDYTTEEEAHQIAFDECKRAGISPQSEIPHANLTKLETRKVDPRVAKVSDRIPARDELRENVRSFLLWLKAQGIM